MMTYVKAAFILITAISLLVVISFWAAGRARTALDDDARDKLLSQGNAYSFIELSQGKVHYHLEGPEDGQLIVLVHGFSTPSFVWDEHFKPLVQAGYRVLAFDNYGRGLSARPDVTYNADLFDTQLVELLDALGVNRRFDLVGYSMGGAIATLFSARHTERVRSLTLIAPAGLGVTSNPNIELLTRPLIGDWIVRLFGTRLFYNGAAEEAKSATNPGAFLAGFNRQLEYRGYGDALLSTLRHYPFTGLDDAYAAVGASSLPVLVTWGEADAVVPYSAATRLMELVPQAQLRSYPSIGHNITFSDPSLVNGLITGFLQTQDARVTSPGVGGKPRGPLSRMESRRCASCTGLPEEGEIAVAPTN